MTLKRGLYGLAAVAVTAGLVVLGMMAMPGRVAARGVPTSRAVSGSLRLDVRTTGELRPGRIVSLAAPPAGSALRIVRIAETGSAVRAGDVVIEFDPAEQLYAVEQAESELAEAEQQIVRMRADLEAQLAQSEVDVLTARFDVRRAELDIKVPPRLITGIDAKKRELAVEESRRRLAQIEHDAESRSVTGRAGLAVVEERRNRSRLAADRARQIIESLDVRAPVDGLVVVRDNRDANGGMYFPGVSLPEYRAGDSVSSGRPVLDISATGDMEIRVKVNEQERSNIASGQAARVEADGLALRPFDARVATIAGIASRSNETAGPLRQFDVSLRLDQVVSGLRAGTTVRVVITGSEVKDVLTIPRQAIFQKNGKSVVYVRTGDRFEAREVKPTHMTESRIAINGLSEGTEVALVNPDAAGATVAPAAAPMPSAGGSR
jgi:HlyD family secretion protein